MVLTWNKKKIISINFIAEIYLFPNNFLRALLHVFLRALLHVFLPFYIIIQIKNIKNDYCRKRALIAKLARLMLPPQLMVDEISICDIRGLVARRKINSKVTTKLPRIDAIILATLPTPLCTLQYIHIYRVNTQAAKQNSRGRSRAHFVIC